MGTSPQGCGLLERLLSDSFFLKDQKRRDPDVSLSLGEANSFVIKTCGMPSSINSGELV